MKIPTKSSKRFLQHILLGSSIFLSLAAVSLPGSVAFAAASLEDSVLTTERKHLQALLAEREAAVTEELAALSTSQTMAEIALEAELRKTTPLKQLTADSFLEEVHSVLTTTMLPGVELFPFAPTPLGIVTPQGLLQQKLLYQGKIDDLTQRKEKLLLLVQESPEITAKLKSKSKELQDLEDATPKEDDNNGDLITLREEIETLRSRLARPSEFAYIDSELPRIISFYNVIMMRINELSVDQPLSLFVVVNEPGKPPRLDFSRFGYFQNAAHVITPALQGAFGTELAAVEAKTNALLSQLYAYNLTEVAERGESIKSKLAALSTDEAAANDTPRITTLQRELEISELTISFVQKAKQLWVDLTESLKRNGRTT